MVTYGGATASGQVGNTTGATKIYWVPGKTESKTWSAYETVERRVENLREIEMGHWTELEKPEVREKVHSTLALAASVLVMVVVALALVIPLHGNTGWSAATTNVVWKKAGK
jgi:hypothetical protein